MSVRCFHCSSLSVFSINFLSPKLLEMVELLAIQILYVKNNSVELKFSFGYYFLVSLVIFSLKVPVLLYSVLKKIVWQKIEKTRINWFIWKPRFCTTSCRENLAHSVSVYRTWLIGYWFKLRSLHSNHRHSHQKW